MNISRNNLAVRRSLVGIAVLCLSLLSLGMTAASADEAARERSLVREFPLTKVDASSYIETYSLAVADDGTAYVPVITDPTPDYLDYFGVVRGFRPDGSSFDTGWRFQASNGVPENYPAELAVDSAGNLYGYVLFPFGSVESGVVPAHTVRKVVVGSNQAVPLPFSTLSTEAYPGNLAVTPGGDVYVTDSDAEGGTVRYLPAGASQDLRLPTLPPQVPNPQGVAVSNGSVFVTGEGEPGDGGIYRLQPGHSSWALVQPYGADFPRPTARTFQNFAYDLDTDAAGDLYAISSADGADAIVRFTQGTGAPEVIGRTAPGPTEPPADYAGFEEWRSLLGMEVMSDGTAFGLSAAGSLYRFSRPTVETTLVAEAKLLAAKKGVLTVTFGQLGARLTTAENTAVPGVRVTFRVGATELCSAITDASGRALCSTSQPLLALFGEVKASFAGAAGFAPSSTTAPLLR